MKIATRARVQSLVVFGSLILGMTGTARAAGAPAASLDDEKQARSLYERAEKGFDLGKFAEALSDYQSAYEAKPLPGFLFNIAQCYRNMSNFERARFFFRRYLALDPHAPNRRRVEELISEMSKQLDARAAEAAAAPPTTTPPAEPKAAEAPGAVAPGAARAATTAPLPVAPAAGVTSTSVPLVTARAAPPAETRRPVWKRWWFWTGAGAVVAGGVVAAVVLARPETRTPGSLAPIDGR
jgi:hypothetical protein